MGNFIWTAILYFSTSTIVFVIYRTFVNDRKADNIRKLAETTAAALAGAKAREALKTAAPPRARRKPSVVGIPSQTSTAG